MNMTLSLRLAAQLTGVLWIGGAGAEEYMQRGASVADYEQALNRVMERQRGLVTGRERERLVSPPVPERTAPPRTVATAAKPAAKSPATSSSAPPKPAARAAPVQRPPAAVPDVYSPAASSGDAADGVSIYFGYNSAELTPSSMRELAQIGQALTLPQFREVSWLIEGHTDASGEDDYNQDLSARRAQSAHRYLVEKFGIEPQQLLAVGKGESEPYDREHPTASVNRRVRLRPAEGG